MSTIRDPAYITDAGRTMMTAGGDVTYTKAVLYGQDISHLTSDQVKALTTIGSPLREVKVGISDKQNTDRGTTVILEATFQNDNLANDLPYTAVGFFAQKGNDEKLIAVAVANTGAYLTATSPDGIATDALDLKLAIAIGDATNVTATVDPAGSVTPATLNGAINKATHDLTSRIDTKADKMTVESELAIKATLLTLIKNSLRRLILAMCTPKSRLMMLLAVVMLRLPPKLTRLRLTQRSARLTLPLMPRQRMSTKRSKQ